MAELIYSPPRYEGDKLIFPRLEDCLSKIDLKRDLSHPQSVQANKRQREIMEELERAMTIIEAREGETLRVTYLQELYTFRAFFATKAPLTVPTISLINYQEGYTHWATLRPSPDMSVIEYHFCPCQRLGFLAKQ